MNRGDNVARLALRKLLQRAERAWAARSKERNIFLLFSQASFPDYLNLPLRSDKDAAHAELRNAERAQAILIEWDRFAGQDGHITRIKLVDPDRIASILGDPPLWESYKNAEDILAPWRNTANIEDILVRWRAGKQIRGCDLEQVAKFSDACKVLAARRETSADEDVPVRRLSAGLFADSKRIEAIIPALDALTTDSLSAPSRSAEEVLSGLGILKLPQPVLIAGHGEIQLKNGASVSIQSPYLGLAPLAIASMALPSGLPYVLTVENLTTFHEIALGRAGIPGGLMLYTAGMPSPAFLRIYDLALAAAGPGIARWHWGDIDLGGFRIAASIAKRSSISLQLWSMDPSAISRDVNIERGTLAPDECREILRIGKQHGWDVIVENVAKDGRAIEQEALPLSLPA